MARFKLIVMSILCSGTFYCQEKKVVIVDVATKLPVPYASVKTEDKELLSNYEGMFTISSISGAITIDHLAYNTEVIDRNAIRDTIFLSQKTIELKPLSISNTKKHKPLIFRNYKKVTAQWFPFYRTKIITLLQPPEKTENRFITELRYKSVFREDMKDSINSDHPVFRFTLYDVNREILYFKTIVYDEDEVKKEIKCTIDLPIPLPKNGLYAGIEFLGFYQPDKTLEPFNKHLQLVYFENKERSLSYSQNVELSDNQWEPIINGHLLFDYMLNVGDLHFANLNPCIEVTLED